MSKRIILEFVWPALGCRILEVDDIISVFSTPDSQVALIWLSETENIYTVTHIHGHSPIGRVGRG